MTNTLLAQEPTSTRQPAVLAADTLTGNQVVNLQHGDLGTIQHLMIDLQGGRLQRLEFSD